MTTTIRLQREVFDVAAETARMTRGRTDIGAVVTFTGLCRADENGEPIAALTLEHYPGMAEAEIARHVEDARARWPLLGVTVIHRYGRIAPGEIIVLVATASSHREAAFAAAAFLMDYLKTRAPGGRSAAAAAPVSAISSTLARNTRFIVGTSVVFRSPRVFVISFRSSVEKTQVFCLCGQYYGETSPGSVMIIAKYALTSAKEWLNYF